MPVYRSLLALALLFSLGCAKGTNYELQRAEAMAPFEASALPPACTRTDFEPDVDRDLNDWFDVDRATAALTEVWGDSTGTVILGIRPSADGAGVWSVTSGLLTDEHASVVLDRFRSSQRNLAIPEDGLIVLLGDRGGPRPILVESLPSCPAELVGDEDAAERLATVVAELEAALGVDEIVGFRLDAAGRPLTLLYRADLDLATLVQRSSGEIHENLWLLASARYRPAYLYGMPVGTAAPLAEGVELDGRYREAIIAGLDRALLSSPGRPKPISRSAAYDAIVSLGAESRASAGTSAAYAGSGRGNPPSGLDWRLRQNEAGTNGLKYFYPQRTFTGNGWVVLPNAPLVHVDVYGRRR